MYQIVYIDIDEEITAVIDKLRKSKTAEVFLAIPKRALILQSIVSLKLLSREAEKLEKNIIIATQDPREQKMAEKAGIETRSSLEGLDTEGEMKESIVPKIQEESVLEKKSPVSKSRQRKNVEEIGSDGFYDVSLSSVGSVPKEKQYPIQPQEKMQGKRSMSEISRETKNEAMVGAESASVSFAESREKEDLLKNFFEEGARDREPVKKFKEEKKTTHLPVSGRMKKAVTIIFVAGILVAGSALAYLFIPKAEVQIRTRSKTAEKDLDLRADINTAEADISNLIIPARMAEKEGSYSFSYPVTGKGKTQGQKAKGMVVIYNEFSTASQSLVATTRLETADKKIFRLVKGVTVPGMNEVDGKKQPGAIEAEVIADASGEEYNIDPTTFTIPGFAGGPKFEKFSAKSTEKMKGGNSTKEGGAAATLTQTDLAMAKGKAEKEAEAKIKEELKSSLGEDDHLIENAIENVVLESYSPSKAGDTASDFQYQVKVRAKALVFSNADVKKVFENVFGSENSESGRSSISLDYGAVSADLGSGSATIKVHGKTSRGAEVDIEKLKADLAGKSGSEIEEIIKNYPQISEIEIDVQPAFLFKKVPQVTSRIDIRVD